MSDTIVAIRVSSASPAGYGLVRYAVERQPDGSYYARPLGQATLQFGAWDEAEAAARATGLPVIRSIGRLSLREAKAINAWIASQPTA